MESFPEMGRFFFALNFFEAFPAFRTRLTQKSVRAQKIAAIRAKFIC